MQATDVEALKITDCHKRGLVVTVNSEALGARILIAPTVDAPNPDGLVVYTWREAYIIAKAKPSAEALQFTHEVKRQLGGTIDSINATGKAKLVGQALGVAAEPAQVEKEGPQPAAYWQAQDSRLEEHRKNVDLAAAKRKQPKPRQHNKTPSQQPAVPVAHYTPPVDVYTVDDPTLDVAAFLPS